MLRLSIKRNGERLTISLTGRLEGSSAEDLSVLMSPRAALDVDLGGLTSVDGAGFSMLTRLRDLGATFYGEGLLAHRLRRRLLWRLST